MLKQRGNLSINLIISLVLAVFAVVSLCTFTVGERQRAIKFQLGKIIRSDYQPGLNFLIPFLQNVKKFDGRVLTLDLEPDRYLTSETKVVIVDMFVKWRIGPTPEDVTSFYTGLSGDENKAKMTLEKMIRDRLRAEFAVRKIQQSISDDRGKVMSLLKESLSQQVRTLGIEIVDVRIKRVDFPTNVSDSVFDRMKQERLKVAKEFRSQGYEQGEKIRAEADRKTVVLVAEANRDAERIRGEGDAKASEIYAKAYSQDAEFFAFYRSLVAYQNAFKSSTNSALVLSPDSEFFNYFNDGGVAQKATASAKN